MRTAPWIVLSAVLVVLLIIFLTRGLVHAKRATPATLAGAELEGQPWALEHSQLLTFLGIAVTTAAALFAIFVAPRFAPHTLHGKERADVQNTIRDTGLKVTAGLAAAFAAVLTWGRLELSRLEHRNEVSGQITERYTRGVDQLGNGDPAVRLGGLYALERIALDSKRDRPMVCRVICAYVRYRTSTEVPPPSTSETEISSAEWHGADANRDPSVTNESSKDANLPPQERRALAVDVRTALSILARPEPFWETAIDLSAARLSAARLPGAVLPGADLSGAVLPGADLSEADLTGARLSAADLTGADLFAAFLIGADLTDANLTDANLTGANLTGAHLSAADLTGARLSEADLRRANLIEANLSGAHLSFANLTDADLLGADLSAADLSNANLGGARLSRTDLTGANLSSANLTHADLWETKLVRARLFHANLTGAKLIGARLSEADLSNADLSNANLSNADLVGARLFETDLSRANVIGAHLTQEQVDSAFTDGTELGPGLNPSPLKANSE